MTQIVNLYPSTTNVSTCRLNPSIYGQEVTLATTVRSTAPFSSDGDCRVQERDHIGGIGHTEYDGSSNGDYENPACRIAISHFDVQRRLGNREEHVDSTATNRESDDKRDHGEVVVESFIEWTDCHSHRLRDVAHDYAYRDHNVHGRQHNTRNWHTFWRKSHLRHSVAEFGFSQRQRDL
jgi:hypothetical protein